jgi:hypothetical protein
MMGKPTFLVIGAQKCGTTSLYEYLGQHPEVFMSPVKELRYFSGEAASKDAAAIDGPVIPDFSTYCEYFEGAAKHQAAGEVSPSYIFYPGTAKHIHRHLPNVRLIAILRDPVERAFSEYWHHWKMGRRLKKDFLGFMLSENVDAEPQLSEYQDCVRRGLYHRQLKPYFRLFDRHQILILLHEDLKANTEALMQRVYEFIGADTGFAPKTSRAYNRGRMPRRDWKYLVSRVGEWWINQRNTEESTRIRYRRRIRRTLNLKRKFVSEKQRDELSDLFIDDIKRLECMIGRDLGHWTQ